MKSNQMTHSIFCEESWICWLKKAGDIAYKLDEISYSHGLSLCELGVSLINVGEYANAIPILRKAVSNFFSYNQAEYICSKKDKNISYGRSLCELGVALLNEGEFSEAIFYLKEAVDIYKKEKNSFIYVRSLTELGVALINAGESDKAVSYLKKAVCFDVSSHGRYFHTLGVALINVGESHEAITYLEKAVGNLKKNGETVPSDLLATAKAREKEARIAAEKARTVAVIAHTVAEAHEKKARIAAVKALEVEAREKEAEVRAVLLQTTRLLHAEMLPSNGIHQGGEGARSPIPSRGNMSL